MADKSSAAPRVKAPPGTCDCHIHIYGPEDKYPPVATSSTRIPKAPLAAYREVMALLGVERVVIVQPAGYGKDNRCTLDAMAALGSDVARAVVVVDTSVSDAELERLTKAGARGIRFHMLPGGVLPWDIIEEMAARVHEHGWHVQLQMDGRLFPEKAAVIKRLPGTVVIDHVGKFLEPVAADHPAFKTLLGFLDRDRFWCKLSAAYETSKKGPPDYADVGVLAKALIAHAPARMLWASNWPHTSMQASPPDNAVQLDMLGYWCPDETTRNRILADNPARLYGFA